MRRSGVKALLAALPALAFVLAGCGSDTGSESDGGNGGNGSTPGADDGARVVTGEVSSDCPASTDALPGYPPEGYGAPRSLTVCLYRSDGGTLRPAWSAELGPRPGKQVVRAVGLGRRSDCRAPEASDEQQLLLRVQTDNDFGDEPLWRDYLVKLDDCPAVVDLTQSDLRGGPTSVDVTERLLAPWAGEGVPEELDVTGLPDDLASYLGPDGE